jgi:hypothetical protein
MTRVSSRTRKICEDVKDEAVDEGSCGRVNRLSC